MFACRGRNIADAGWRVVGVEVSADAASAGRHIANKSLAPAALERFELLAYDALALPQVTPKRFCMLSLMCCGFRESRLKVSVRC